MERAEDCETAKVSAYKWKNRNLYIKLISLVPYLTASIVCVFGSIVKVKDDKNLLYLLHDGVSEVLDSVHWVAVDPGKRIYTYNSNIKNICKYIDRHQLFFQL